MRSVRLIALLVVILTVATLSVAPALAAKGGKGNGGNGGNGAKTTATLTVSPNPPLAGTAFQISGSGLNANKMVVVGVSGWIPFETLTTDGSGAFSFTYTRTLDPGTYTVLAYQEKGKRWVVKATATLTVVP